MTSVSFCSAGRAAGGGSRWAGSGWTGALCGCFFPGPRGCGSCARRRPSTGSAQAAGVCFAGSHVPRRAGAAPRFPNLFFNGLVGPAGALHALQAGRGAFVMAQHPCVRFGEGIRAQTAGAQDRGSAFLAVAHTAQWEASALALVRSGTHLVVSVISAQVAATGPRFLQPVTVRV